MKSTMILRALSTTAMAGLAMMSLNARAAEAGTENGEDVTQSDGSQIQDIVVTAQKREQSLNDVGMTITAIGTEALNEKGVVSVDDLTKVVPGFNAIATPQGVPVYSLRGVGFYNTTLASTPAVTVYVDEVPLPYPVMSAGVALDLERVEVLKGPQGTLFGQNSTGGAINFIAAKPTSDFAAGLDTSIGRFAAVDVTGYVSGPIAGNLRARLSLSSQTSDDWQRAYTRDDSIGSKNLLLGRLLFDWTPTDRLSATFGVSGWRDKSDSQAGQYVLYRPLRAGAASPELQNYPVSPRDARSADWSQGPQKRDNNLVQAWARFDYDFGAAQLTSISSYAEYNRDERVDSDGVALRINNRYGVGNIQAFNQEVRLASPASDAFRWTVGANYSWDKTHDYVIADFSDSTSATATGLRAENTGFSSDQRFEAYAAFGNVEYDLADALTVKLGARYTDASRRYSGCSNDTGDGLSAAAFSALWSRLKGSTVPIAPGGCYTLIDPVNFVPGVVRAELNEDKVSWRAGLDWRATDDALVYLNVSKGYKAGAFISAAATTITQYAPVTQESVVAYEGGVKAKLLGGAVQANAAIFYYDYTDKQVLGRIPVPVFRSLDALVNIPKSSIFGQEIALTAIPLRGLQFDLSVVHVDAKIDQYTGYNDLAVVLNFDNTAMPLTPEWDLTASAKYEWAVSNAIDAFVIGDLHSRSSTNAYPGEDAVFAIESYTTADLQAGLRSSNDRWRFAIWGRNITNSYYYNNVQRQVDTVVRMTGRPATYGISIGLKFD